MRLKYEKNVLVQKIVKNYRNENIELEKNLNNAWLLHSQLKFTY